MKYYIIPAKDVQVGDVIFTNQGNNNGIKFCGRVLGQTVPSPHPTIIEWRVEVVAGDDSKKSGAHTTLDFQHGDLVGVAREDHVVETDITAILADLTKNS